MRLRFWRCSYQRSSLLALVVVLSYYLRGRSWVAFLWRAR